MTAEEIGTLAQGLALLLLLLPFIGFVLLVFWFTTLVLHLRSPKGDPERLTWTLVLIFLNWIGAILYWALRTRPPGRRGGAGVRPPPLPSARVTRPTLPAVSTGPALSRNTEGRMDTLDPDWRYKPLGYQAELRSRAGAGGDEAVGPRDSLNG